MSSEATAPPATEHATSIIIAETGILFVGPSGSGKSKMAFDCLAAAGMRGWNAALIADDRTILSREGGRCIASCPPAIQGLMELRGAGIVPMPRRERAVIHLVVALQSPSPETRLPRTGETFACLGLQLPLLRLWSNSTQDPLSGLCTLRPELF